jgi:hypothetical protein
VNSSTLDEKTTRLLLLALDPQAAPGEVENAAVAFVRRLRSRFSDGHAFLAELADKAELPDVANVYGAVKMPFGRHRDRRLRDIPPDYLLWVLDNCTNADPYLRTAIRRYLEFYE